MATLTDNRETNVPTRYRPARKPNMLVLGALASMHSEKNHCARVL